MLSKKWIILLFLTLLVAGYGLLAQDAISIDETGNVGIGTSTPSAPLDVVGNTEINGNTNVSGDLTVNGTVYGNVISDQAYEAWAVGQYYSIPPDERLSWIYAANPSTSWSTIDISNSIPMGTKRVRVFMYATGDEGSHEMLIVWLRPYGSTANNYETVGKGLLRTGDSGDSIKAHLGLEVEVDVVDGKFQIRDHGSSYSASGVNISLRGFYK